MDNTIEDLISSFNDLVDVLRLEINQRDLQIAILQAKLEESRLARDTKLVQQEVKLSPLFISDLNDSFSEPPQDSVSPSVELFNRQEELPEKSAPLVEDIPVLNLRKSPQKERTVTCNECRKEFTYTSRSSYNYIRKYCDDCKIIVRRDRMINHWDNKLKETV